MRYASRREMQCFPLPFHLPPVTCHLSYHHPRSMAKDSTGGTRSGESNRSVGKPARCVKVPGLREGRKESLHILFNPWRGSSLSSKLCCRLMARSKAGSPFATFPPCSLSRLRGRCAAGKRRHDWCRPEKPAGSWIGGMRAEKIDRVGFAGSKAPKGACILHFNKQFYL